MKQKVKELPGHNKLSFSAEHGRYVLWRKNTRGEWDERETFADLQQLLDWLWVSGKRHPIFGEQREDA